MRQKGQTLIEFLIALAAAVVIISAIGGAVVTTLNNAQFSKNQNLGNQYANQGMEIIRKTFSSYATGEYCLDKDSATLVERNPTVQGCNGQNVDIFARKVNIERDAADCTVVAAPMPTVAKVTVSVLWSDNKCTSRRDLFCHAITLVSCFVKREIQQGL